MSAALPMPPVLPAKVKYQVSGAGFPITTGKLWCVAIAACIWVGVFVTVIVFYGLILPRLISVDSVPKQH